MFDRLKAWLRGNPEYADPDPKVREALRTGRREWAQPGGATLRLLSTDEELRMTPAERWARHNAEARAAGCKCGQPGRLVRSYPVVGANFEVYACEEHADVISWRGKQRGDGPVIWEPAQRGELP